MEENNNEGRGPVPPPGSPETENKPQEKEGKRRWVFSDLAKNGVWYTLGFSLFIFALYSAGSVPDPGFSDRVLFILLRILRYSSLISTAFSLFGLGFSVRRIVYYPSLRNGFALLLYFLAGLLSASLSMLDLFIIAATEGNV